MIEYRAEKQDMTQEVQVTGLLTIYAGNGWRLNSIVQIIAGSPIQLIIFEREIKKI